MIRFNRKPGFFLTNPNGKGKRQLKAIVDITYDSDDHRDIKPLVDAFRHIFSCSPMGPDDHPMKLGTFAFLEAPLFKAGVRNANGDVYPEDVVVQSLEKLPPVRHESVSMSCKPLPWWKRLWNRIGGRHG